MSAAPNLNSSLSYHQQQLLAACWQGQDSLVTEVLDTQMSPNYRDKDGTSPILLAANQVSGPALIEHSRA